MLSCPCQHVGACGGRFPFRSVDGFDVIRPGGPHGFAYLNRGEWAQRRNLHVRVSGVCAARCCVKSHAQRYRLATREGKPRPSGS